MISSNFNIICKAFISYKGEQQKINLIRFMRKHPNTYWDWHLKLVIFRCEPSIISTMFPRLTPGLLSHCHFLMSPHYFEQSTFSSAVHILLPHWVFTQWAPSALEDSFLPFTIWMMTTHSRRLTSNVSYSKIPWPKSPATIISSFRFPNHVIDIFTVAVNPLSYNLLVNVSVVLWILSGLKKSLTYCIM